MVIILPITYGSVIDFSQRSWTIAVWLTLKTEFPALFDSIEAQVE